MSQIEEFEAWAIDRGMDVNSVDEPRPYLASETQAAYDAWMAATRKQDGVFSSKDQAQAWLAVATLLSELVPDWTKREGANGMDCALETIRELHAQAQTRGAPRLHCELTLTRCAAPTTAWMWTVKLPNGHVWAITSRSTFDDALASMRETGVRELLAADTTYREHSRYGGEEVRRTGGRRR